MAEAILAGQADPNQGLSGLNNLARDMNCPGCFIWERATFAEQAGRFEEARDLFLAATEHGSDNYLLEPIMRVVVNERLGAIYEALGDSAMAAEHYAIFADYWADADEELQPRVQAARDKVASLGGS